MSEKITVFDIEVLNQDPASLCAIGIVEIQNQEVVSTYYALVKPKNLSFDSYRYKIHQIRPQSLYKEKTFVEVWKDIHHYFENTIVVSCEETGKTTTVAFTDILVMDQYSYYYYGTTSYTEFDGEGQLTSAVNYVTSDSQKKIYYTTGHGEATFSSSVTDLLEKNNNVAFFL